MAEALRAVGDDAEEARVLEEAARLDPNAAGPQVLLGARAERAGDRTKALTHFDAALKAEPANADAHVRRAMILAALRRFGEAETELAGLTRDRPETASHWIAYGAVLGQLHKVDAAETAYRRALAIAPDLAEAHHGLATVMDARQQGDAAIDGYRRAAELAPQDPLVKTNYATLLTRIGRMREAEALFEEALSIAPGLPSANNNLGSLLIKTGDVERGVALEMRAAELEPDNADYAGNILFVAHYDPARTAEQVAEAHFAWGRARASLADGAPPFANDRDPERRLKVGYVSPDFRSHSVGHNFYPVLAAHDPAAVEVTLYGEIEKPDSMTEAIRAKAGAWRSTLGVSDEDVAARIRADRIDILVDLAGHTGGNRLGVFARRAAPVQVTWLGYPDTTGLKQMDYRLVDAIADPEGAGDRLASETLVRLPDGFIVAIPSPDTPSVSVPPVFRKGHVTFGSFNNLAKVNKSVIALWADVIEAVPGSRLLLKSSFNSDDWVHDRFRATFAEHGIPSERLEFRARTVGLKEHLALYGEVDIALDPFPYNGTMTTLEGLSMGVPLVALLGPNHVARVSASLLTRVGHPEWIAADAPDYVRVAAALASDKAKLAAIRVRLRQEYLASPLAQPERLARAIENAYRAMWRKWLG